MPRKKEPGLKNCLKALRTASAGMTQQELADRVGVTRQTIVALEGGEVSGYLGSSGNGMSRMIECVASDQRPWIRSISYRGNVAKAFRNS